MGFIKHTKEELTQSKEVQNLLDLTFVESKLIKSEDKLDMVVPTTTQ
ncbi:hypothetical protein ACE939_00690 [Aquimarina sp. W85]